MNTRIVRRRTVLGGLASLPFWRWVRGADEAPPPIRYRREPPPVTAAGQVLNVMDFEPLARAALPPAHYGYIATGADSDETVGWNHDAFGQIEIRAHRFVDVSH